MGTRRLPLGRPVGWILLGLAVLITVFPFYWMVRTAVTPAADLFTDAGSLWPHHPTLINFARVLGLVGPERARAAGGSGAQIEFLRYTANSIIYSGLIAGVQTFCCAMAGYAFARLRFPGRNLTFGVIVGALMVPPIFTLLPNFSLVKDLGLINTFAGMVAPSLLIDGASFTSVTVTVIVCTSVRVPVPLSVAPVAPCQLSRWAESRTYSLGSSVPLSSATTSNIGTSAGVACDSAVSLTRGPCLFVARRYRRP